MYNSINKIMYIYIMSFIFDSFKSIGGSVIELIVEVMCAPYSLPIGLINHLDIITIDSCYNITKKELDLKETTEYNSVFTGELGTQKSDLSNISDFSILNRNVMNILDSEKQISNINITAKNSANVECPFETREGDDNFENFMKTENLTRKYKGIDVPVYHCCPKVNQSTTIQIVTINKLSKKKSKQIISDIEAHITNTTMELKGGVDEVNVDAQVKSSNKVQNDLVNNIQNQILQANSQNINIHQGLEYIDRYGMCDPTTFNPMTGNVSGKTLKQSIDIKALSMNIIDSSIKIMMENNVKIKSDTTVKINRVGNYRIIVLSMIWDCILIYMIFKAIQKRIRGY
tara:strand:+ start:830 stop:1861 length:1032 start_codon:yes stop_codon:yes gene_type:complete